MRSRRLLRIALAGLVGLAGCGTGASGRATPPSSAIPSSASAPATAGSSSAPAHLAPPLSVLIEPGAGMAPIYALLRSARRSVELVMYELEDTEAEQLLAGDAARGVDVRVLPNSAYTGSANDGAFEYLERHGVHVRWSSSLYALTHQKTLVVDGSVAVVMTLNWTSRYYSGTRDVAVFDRIASDVSAIEATFDADDSGSPIAAGRGADLVWSPTTSLTDLLALIGGAKHELLVENEEMSNTDIIEALMAAARRGVTVEICMTDSSSWSSAFAALAGAGVHIRVYAPDATLYIHAKVIVRDPGSGDQQAFAGSQNFSTESLRYNRELGIVLDDGLVVGQLAAMLQRDDNGASPWNG